MATSRQRRTKLSAPVVALLTAAVQLEHVHELISLVDRKMVELGTTLELYEGAQVSLALELVRSDEAAALMHRVRQLVEEMRTREEGRLEARTLHARRNLDVALWI